jgi:hypothetical protein
VQSSHVYKLDVKKKEVARNKFNMRATIVYSGEEPLSFKALFITWNDEKTKVLQHINIHNITTSTILLAPEENKKRRK